MLQNTTEIIGDEGREVVGRRLVDMKNGQNSSGRPIRFENAEIYH